jgi:hypothetical protein
MPLFKEQQLFPLWTYLLFLPAPVIFAAVALVPGVPQLTLFTIGVVVLAVTLFLVNLLYMKTTITEERLVVSFGYAFPVYRKSFLLSEIQQEGPVTYRPLRDGGGWGIRWGRFNGRPCRFLNARGNRGVLINSPKSPFIIGSQDPEALAQAISSSADPVGAE